MEGGDSLLRLLTGLLVGFAWFYTPQVSHTLWTQSNDATVITTDQLLHTWSWCFLSCYRTCV